MLCDWCQMELHDSGGCLAGLPAPGASGVHSSACSQLCRAVGLPVSTGSCTAKLLGRLRVGICNPAVSLWPPKPHSAMLIRRPARACSC